ncbi:MAG: hypothetical protein EA402_03130 [Planctomycetota bacterium]|nr:MAG: hypothetical protein EA402_03130 [Planctomycetota bacterium]
MTHSAWLIPLALGVPLLAAPLLAEEIVVPVDEPPSELEPQPGQPEALLPDSQGRSPIAPTQSGLEQRRSLAMARMAALAASSERAGAVRDVRVPPRWEYDGRLGLGGGYDSNPRRQGDIMDVDVDGGGVLRAEGLARGAWSGGPYRISLGLSGSHDWLPAVDDADSSNLGLTLGARRLAANAEGDQAWMLAGNWDSRRWFQAGNSYAWTHTAGLSYSHIRASWVQSLSASAMHLRYQDDDADDGTGVWLAWRSWCLLQPNQALPRLESQLRVGRWFADDDYWTIAASGAWQWRQDGAHAPRLGIFDAEMGAGVEYRWRNETENQVLVSLRAEGGVWFNSWLKAATYVRWNASFTDTDANDYRRTQVGSMLLATF